MSTMSTASAVVLCAAAVLLTSVTAFTMRDVGITDDIHRVACSLNDMFKESFDLMIGSLGKHGVYSLPEIRQTLADPHRQTQVQFLATNGWLKFPKLQAAEGIRTGALRKYKMPGQEVLLACVRCLELSAEGVNYCYEATAGAGHNVSGTVTGGPVVYSLSLELRVAGGGVGTERCAVSVGQRSLELNDRSVIHSETRGLRSLNYLADHIDDWLVQHLNTTVQDQLEHRLLAAFTRVTATHDACAEFISHQH